MRLLCNSWPKAGTHLLLELARQVVGEGAWYRERAIKGYRGDLGRLLLQVDDRVRRHGQSVAIKGHYPWSVELERELLARGFKLLLMIRDPRDVLCSTLRWLRDLRPDWEASRVLQALPSEAMQLAAVIEGLPKHLEPFAASEVRWELPLPQRYASITPWTRSASCCVVRYEALSGNLGHTVQLREVRRTLEFLGLGESIAASRVAANLRNPQAATFHSGRSGTWRDHFLPSHCRMFVDLGGEVLVERFGYEATPYDRRARWSSVRSLVMEEAKRIVRGDAMPFVA